MTKDHPETETSLENLHRQIAALQEERRSLLQENDRLRKLLDLPKEQVESPLLAVPNPRLFPETDLLPMIDSNSTVTEKVAIFRILFRGREDVYPVLWISARSGKKGYSPAVKGGWNDPKEKEKDYLPLTSEVIEKHLSGEKTIGVYPLLRNDTCLFLASDFDGADWAEDALGFWSACKRNGVPAYLERSRSGEGGHVWIFFSGPVLAANARRLGASLLRDAMSMRGGIDLSSYDRFFPSQDMCPKGGFGNLIALPLQKKCRVLGNTEFLDPVTLQPWADQWVFLSKIQRLTPDHVAGFLEKIPPVAVGFGSIQTQKKPLPKEVIAPSTISCTLGSVLVLEKTGIPPSLLSEIKHLASLHNPVFYERQKLRLSTYRTPRFIRCYEQDTAHIALPRGVLEELTAAVERVGSRLVVRDLRPRPEKVPLTFSGRLSDLQDEAVKAVLVHDQGVLVAPPGLGKTVMGCFIMTERKLPTLILVHRKPLLEQWRLQLMNLLGLTSRGIGQIGGGKNRQTGIVDLAMIQTLKKMKDAESFFSTYGFIIIDECHHIPAFSFESSIKKAPVRFILGLTATPYRRDGLQDIIMMQCGQIRHRISARSGNGEDLNLELLVRETDFRYETEEIPFIQDIFRALVHSEPRSKLICKDILLALEKRCRCLVLSQWKEHCKFISEELMARGKRPIVLEGGLRKKERLALLKAIRDVSPEEDLLVIATGQYLGEGFDCPQLDTLFLTFPLAFKGRLVQYIGRLMRNYGEKETVRVYDYVDKLVPVLKRMYIKRLKTYKMLGFGVPTGNKEVR